MEFLLEINKFNLIWEYLCKSTLILSLSLLLVFLFRKQTATLRHFLISASLISLLLLPLFSIVSSGWETRLLPSWQTWKKSPVTSDELRESQKSLSHPSQTKNYISGKTLQGSSRIGSFQQERRVNNSKFRNLLGYSLLGGWLFGFILLMLKSALGLYGAHRLTQQGKNITNPYWQQLMHRFLAVISLKRRINLLSHNQATVPLTWGFIKPVVIMPGQYRKWSDDQRSSALFHELSHVKRSDFLVMMLSRLSCAVYWFNPLSWLVYKKLRREQEKACDELVLKAGIKPSTYAATLLAIKKSGELRWNPPTAVLGAVGNSQLNERLNAILKQKLNLMEVKMKTKILLSFLLIMAVTLIGMARPSHSAANYEKSFANNPKALSETQDSQQSDAAEVEQEEKQADKTEKKDSKSKEEKKKTIKWTAKSGAEGPIEVIIYEGDKVRKLKLEDHPVIFIEKDASGKKTVSISLGKDLVIDKNGKDFHIHKGDKTTITDEVEEIKIDKGEVTKIKVMKKEDGSKVVVLEGPHIKILRDKKSPRHISIFVGDEKEGKKRVIVAPRVKVHPVVRAKPLHIDVTKKLKKIQELLKKIETKKIASLDALDQHEKLVREIKDKEIQKKLENIHERILKELEAKTAEQEKALKELEISLGKLNKKLEEKAEKRKKIHISVDEDRVILDKEKQEVEEEDVTVIKKEKDLSVEVTEHEESFILEFKIGFDKIQTKSYQKALKKLKEELPENYKVESIIDKDTNTVHIKITGSDTKGEPKKKIKKLLKEFEEKLSK